jgi:TonB family protein
MNCHLDRSVAEWRDLRFCGFSRTHFKPLVGAPAFMRGKERLSAPGKNPPHTARFSAGIPGQEESRPQVLGASGTHDCAIRYYWMALDHGGPHIMNRSVFEISRKWLVPLVVMGVFCCAGRVTGQTNDSMSVAAEVVSDTQGVDFAPYMRQTLSMLKKSWVSSLPEGVAHNGSEAVIRFTISQNGSISAMVLQDSSHQIAVDRAAWGSITGVGQFPSLPADFNGPSLTLNVHFRTKPSGS